MDLSYEDERRALRRKEVAKLAMGKFRIRNQITKGAQIRLSRDSPEPHAQTVRATR